MKQPSRRGTPVSLERRQHWINSFRGYRHAIDDLLVQNWLAQFDEEDKDIGARILDSVEFITPEEIDAAYRTLLGALPGWDLEEKNRSGVWKFVPFTSSPGESGDRMIHQFRGANNLSGRKYDNLFAYRSEIAGLRNGDTVIFVDDFSGSGSQVTEYWPTLSELIAGGPTAYLMLVAATERAQDVITSETDLRLHSSRLLDSTDDIFSTSCKHFNRSEKATIEAYCAKADKRLPKGRGECGLLLVLAHKAPNNTIPILHKKTKNWNGLFRRYN